MIAAMILRLICSGESAMVWFSRFFSIAKTDSIASIHFHQDVLNMAYVNYDPESNYYEVIRGVYNSSREFREDEASPDISFLVEGQDIAGVRLRNIFEKNEVLGAKGEEYIKGFMERNGVPYLYVGQGPTGIQKSEVLKNDLQAHRPDFLIHLPDLGTLFFDVKCRWRRAFNEKGDTCFYLFRGEMEALIKLHFNLFIPVWVAFLDSHTINRKDPRPAMHMVCASQLSAFWTELKKHLSEKEVRSLGVIRLPTALLQEVKEKLEFQIGIQKIPEDLVARYADLHRGMVRRVQDEVRTFIRKNQVLKTGMARKMLTLEKLPFLLDADVNAALNSMIHDNIIRFEERKPLTLVGE